MSHPPDPQTQSPLGACGEPIGPCYTPAAQMAAATAVKVSPMMNTAISNRVIGQMLRIAPQCWTVSDQHWPESIGVPKAPFGPLRDVAGCCACGEPIGLHNARCS